MRALGSLLAVSSLAVAVLSFGARAAAAAPTTTAAPATVATVALAAAAGPTTAAAPCDEACLLRLADSTLEVRSDARLTYAEGASDSGKRRCTQRSASPTATPSAVR